MSIYKGNPACTEEAPCKIGDKVYARIYDFDGYRYPLCTVTAVKFTEGDPEKSWIKPYWTIGLRTEENGYLSSRSPTEIVPISAKPILDDLMAYKVFHEKKVHDWLMIETGYRRALECLGVKK